MCHIIKLLIVEDTASDIQAYQDTIRTVNLDLAPEYRIEATFKRTKSEGVSALMELKDTLNGAFIDLKLQSGSALDVNEGNEIVREIYGKLRFPVIVLTNTPGAFDGNLVQSEFLQVVTKTDVQYSDVLMSMVRIHKAGVTNILGKRGIIERMLDDIFWKSISSSLPEWYGIPNSEKQLLRYILTHIQEHLEISDDASEFTSVLPIETYIKPCIKQYPFTGDIIQLKSDRTKRYVILTPACDLAPHGLEKTPKAKEVAVAEIVSFNEGVMRQTIETAKNTIDPSKMQKAQEDLKKLLNNTFSQKYYFLPDTRIVSGGLINFQKLLSISIKEIKANYDREATITAQFVKDIIARFSFYYSRQGSPDFDFAQLYNTQLTK